MNRVTVKKERRTFRIEEELLDEAAVFQAANRRKYPNLSVLMACALKAFLKRETPPTMMSP